MMSRGASFANMLAGSNSRSAGAGCRQRVSASSWRSKLDAFQTAHADLKFQMIVAVCSSAALIVALVTFIQYLIAL